MSAAESREPRQLGPGVEIPREFTIAQDKLVQKLMAPDSRKVKGKGAGRENILSVHIGQKRSKGKPTGSLAVVVSVLKKYSPAKVQPKYRIPKQVKVGKVLVPVDVKLGSLIAPNAGGGAICGIEKPDIGRGSIGCFCFKNVAEGHYDFLLTGNHVIGRFVNGNPGGDSSEDDVFQYADFVQNSPHGAQLTSTLIKMGTLDGPDGSIDAAIAYTNEQNPPGDANQHAGLKFSGTIVRASEGDEVMLFGARSKVLAKGTVRRRLAAKDVPYLAQNHFPINRVITIKDVLVITPISGPTDEHGNLVFSQGGDSGSLVITSDGHPTGLLIAGGTDTELGQISLVGDLTTIKGDLGFDGIHPVE
jgi:hypothetical protein